MALCIFASELAFLSMSSEQRSSSSTFFQLNRMNNRIGYGRLDRVGSSDNLNLSGVRSFMQVCEKRSQATRKKMEPLQNCGN